MGANSYGINVLRHRFGANTFARHSLDASQSTTIAHLRRVSSVNDATHTYIRPYACRNRRTFPFHCHRGFAAVTPSDTFGRSLSQPPSGRNSVSPFSVFATASLTCHHCLLYMRHALDVYVSAAENGNYVNVKIHISLMNSSVPS